MTLSSRILLADALRYLSHPGCRVVHETDPSCTVSLRCCNRTWQPRRSIVGISLHQLTKDPS